LPPATPEPRSTTPPRAWASCWWANGGRSSGDGNPSSAQLSRRLHISFGDCVSNLSGNPREGEITPLRAKAERRIPPRWVMRSPGDQKCIFDYSGVFREHPPRRDNHHPQRTGRPPPASRSPPGAPPRLYRLATFCMIHTRGFAQL